MMAFSFLRIRSFGGWHRPTQIWNEWKENWGAGREGSGWGGKEGQQAVFGVLGRAALGGRTKEERGSKSKVSGEVRLFPFWEGGKVNMSCLGPLSSDTGLSGVWPKPSHPMSWEMRSRGALGDSEGDRPWRHRITLVTGCPWVDLPGEIQAGFPQYRPHSPGSKWHQPRTPREQVNHQWSCWSLSLSPQQWHLNGTSQFTHHSHHGPGEDR